MSDLNYTSEMYGIYLLHLNVSFVVVPCDTKYKW